MTALKCTLLLFVVILSVTCTQGAGTSFRRTRSRGTPEHVKIQRGSLRRETEQRIGKRDQRTANFRRRLQTCRPIVQTPKPGGKASPPLPQATGTFIVIPTSNVPGFTPDGIQDVCLTGPPFLPPQNTNFVWKPARPRDICNWSGTTECPVNLIVLYDRLTAGGYDSCFLDVSPCAKYVLALASCVPQILNKTECTQPLPPQEKSAVVCVPRLPTSSPTQSPVSTTTSLPSSNPTANPSNVPTTTSTTTSPTNNPTRTPSTTSPTKNPTSNSTPKPTWRVTRKPRKRRRSRRKGKKMRKRKRKRRRNKKSASSSNNSASSTSMEDKSQENSSSAKKKRRGKRWRLP